VPKGNILPLAQNEQDVQLGKDWKRVDVEDVEGSSAIHVVTLCGKT